MGKKPYIVGITGGTCGGKTTLVQRLEEVLKDDWNVHILHMDKYFKRPSPTTIAPITRIEYVEHNHPDTLDLDLLYADFNKIADGMSEENVDILLIEGLFALYLDEIRDKLDLKVFVDLKSDERIVRRIKRFMSFGQTLEEVTDRYLDTVRFRHDELIEPTRWHADIVLNGTLDTNRGVDIVRSYIELQAKPVRK